MVFLDLCGAPMPENRQPGKLAVILHADIAGSTLLVQQDEQLAHQRIQETFRRFSDIIARYHGRVHELRGDALLAEFERTSDAVSATLSFQAKQVEYTAELEDSIVPKVRTGIAMGEVVIADKTVTGEGVVLAQRVEQLAEPGGLCITGAIHEALPSRMPFDRKSLGEQKVKGFEEAVRVYRVAVRAGEVVPSPGELRKPKGTTIRAIAAAAIILVVAGGTVLWLTAWPPSKEPGLSESMVLPLPDKPSIAVLPFEDLSPDEPERLLADGLTETLISTLGQVNDLFVIARSSVMVYRGKPIDARQIRRELGVRYVLNGSVQQNSGQVRVTAQLIDTSTAEHVWAERFDRPVNDIFVLQDEIAFKVLVSLQVQLTDGEAARLRSSTTKNVDAYLNYQKGLAAFFTYTKDAMQETRRLMDQALKRDPDFTGAMIVKAWTHVIDARLGYTDSREQSMAKAEAELERMENLGQELSVLATGEAFMIRGFVELLRGNYESAVELGEDSIELLPNHADMVAAFGMFLHFAGEQERAIEVFKKAMRVSPHYRSWYATHLAQALILAEDPAGAASVARDAITRAKNESELMVATARQRMAIVYIEQGKPDMAKEEAKQAMELAPWLSLGSYASMMHFQNEEDLERLADALRDAGFPD